MLRIHTISPGRAEAHYRAVSRFHHNAENGAPGNRNKTRNRGTASKSEKLPGSSRAIRPLPGSYERTILYKPRAGLCGSSARLMSAGIFCSAAIPIKRTVLRNRSSPAGSVSSLPMPISTLPGYFPAGALVNRPNAQRKPLQATFTSPRKAAGFQRPAAPGRSASGRKQ